MVCTLWVLARARDEGLKKLERVPAGVRVVVGDTAEAFDGQPPADAIFVCSMGRELLRAVLPKAPGARWVHSRSVGVENILFPGLAESGVTLTNGRGVFSPSPVTRRTTRSDSPTWPRRTASRRAPSVTPAAVSPKMPAVSARSAMFSPTSSSGTA